ncbi:ectopic P granules protein 5 homolog isoform X1 [Stomoxys calcitrans]|uniref:ectopic P granules protein 5 homolog isoform X1 n=1 Tax=Stomoxys calcitrans TaxID=35570 RepID=UPI0027E32A54|nr:ectopic P granules protein 5 homolog isoform X1 [Stomoxys calcitrans]
MATMEKPKKSKTKKAKPKSKEPTPLMDEEELEEDSDKETTSNLGSKEVTVEKVSQSEVRKTSIEDIIQSATSTANIDNIVTQECFVAADFKQKENENENKEKVEQEEICVVPVVTAIVAADESSDNVVETDVNVVVATNETITENEILTVNASPSAPPALTANSSNATAFPSETSTTSAQMVQYPQLQMLRHEEAITEVVYKPPRLRSPGFRLSSSKLQALSQEQLQQYYYCPELSMVQQFEMEFLMNSLLETYENDPLYAALQEYYHLQSKLTMNLHDVKKFRKEAAAAQEHIWVEVPITKTFSEKCGDKVEVRETVTYNIVQVNGSNLEAATSSLTVLFDIISNTYTSNLITTKIVKIKIDQMIDEIIVFPFKRHEGILEGPLKLHKQLDNDCLHVIAQIRRALSILFHFSRKLSPNKDFDKDLKSWLQKLISLHLRLATKEDHWFLLFNILRCPSGVGAWASEFLQVPCNKKDLTPVASSPTAHTNEVPLPLNSPEIGHCMSVLQILLLPIKKRNEYLKQFTQSQKEITDPAKEERWILIDSDGEDSHTASGDCVGLKESDLIALLNQIPFEELFRSALTIEKFLDDYIIEADLISSQQMLQVLAFFSQLLNLFGEGMLTYSTERYKQLAKRLGRLMRHSLQYVSDYYDLFRQNNLSKDLAVCERIALEANVLLLKACSYIYRTRNLATWQYFSSLPFSSMDSDIVWQIFYYLNVGFPLDFSMPEEDYMEHFNASDFWGKFNVANADSSDEDLYYLLQAFFEMANDRDKTKDWDLIKTICLHIFHIGYLNVDTRDICYKTARDMLVNLTLTYEDLLSCLLTQLKIRFSDCENVVYLFKSLPLENWKPSMESFEVLSNWLLHFDFRSAENMLARIIISHLNWSFDCDGRLFLPHNIHVRMACLISEALNKHAPEVLGLSGISESVRQVSSLIDFSQSTKEQFTTWCWSIVSILRLHIMDQNVETIKRCLQNPSEGLMFVSELERIDMIHQGVNENRPLALYVAILVSLHGHSIPVICQKGFELMQRLLSDHRHAAVIRCLELIVPLFLESPDTLGNSERFHAILNSLLNADKTYLKMAKDMVFPNTVGPVLELLDNMIHHQITSYTSYGLTSPLNLINVWLNCLTALPNWQNTYVVYLLDKILRVAYQFPDAHMQCLEFFNNYYRECTDWKGTTKMSSLKGLFGGSQSKVPALSPYQPWLAMILLEIEFKTQDTFIWMEFLRQLGAGGTNANVEAVLKKTLSISKRSSFPANMLVVYKYANLVANMDINHALFPIVNQKFFELFLARIPSNFDEHSFQQINGVSDKIYEYNVPLMKKIKTQLKAAETFYDNEAKTHANDDALSYYYRNCVKITKTYALWLEDTAINKMTRDQDSYPPQYNNEKLKEIFNGPTNHWTEFLYLPAIRKEQRYQADQWARKCYRLRATKQLRTPLQAKPKVTPKQRIKSHLSSYDKRLAAPKYVKPDLLIQHSDITQNSLKELKEKLKVLTSTATKFHFKTSELNSINRNYMDNIVQLYKMVPYEEIKIKNCNSLVFNRRCSSPARIVTILEKIRKDEQIQHKIDAFRERHDKIVDEMLKENVEEFARCVGQIGQILRLLLTRQMANNQHNADDRLKSNTGINFFYHVIENMSEITMKFNATNKFYTELLNDLGVFIQENQEDEGLKILELALKRPNLLKELSGVCVPCQTRPPYFLQMYKFLIDSHLKLCDTKTLFVLFSKFDLILWLEAFNPKLFDINQLLQLVLQGLESWSQPSSSLLQDQFRRHLVHIFDHDFPEHYGEVMQMVLNRISDKKLMPIVLLDLLNSLLMQYNCEVFTLDTPQNKIQEISMDFARRQSQFNLKAATDTVMLFARHFQKERLAHGLHGLYPKHKDYCQPLAMWFSCFGHCVVVSAICTYQELLADQICDLIFGSIIEMYSPWLIIYTEQTIQQSSANWIRQLVDSGNGKMLYPWSAQHAKTSKVMIKNFVQTLMFILQNLPISHKILAHCFSWYIHHFAVANVESHIFGPIHEGMAELPWEHFQPQVEYVDMLYDSLQKFIPESHAMLAHIFIRLNWNDWFTNTLPTIPSAAHKTLVSRLFTIFIKIAFEPNIHMQINTSKILEDAIKYPWHMVEYSELENLMKWFCTTVEPTIVLRIPEETNYADRAVLDLIRLACAMMPEIGNEMQQISNATAKRILYTRSMIRLQRSCAAKNPKLFATKEGKKVFNNAFEELLQTLNQSLRALAATKSHEEQRREALNVMLEIILPMQTQSEETSNLHIDSIIKWQATTAEPGNILMCSILSALGHMKAFIGGTYVLLESTICFYFRSSESSLEWHTPTWINLLQTLQMSLEKLELMPIMRNCSMFTLNVYILYKMEKMPTVGDQITFMQDLCQLIESIKTEPSTEAMMTVVWGSMIAWGCKIFLKEPQNSRKPLIMLSRHLQHLSSQAEGWGDGLLGAIGLKRDVVTNKRKVLTRCLAIVILSLFPNISYSGERVEPNEEYCSSMRELSMLLANKKFLDVKPLVVQAVNILKENTLPKIQDVSHLVCRLISLFYCSSFLTSVPEVWEMDFHIPSA